MSCKETEIHSCRDIFNNIIINLYRETIIYNNNNNL